jgi:uncharacterized membrane protein
MKFDRYHFYILIIAVTILVLVCSFTKKTDLPIERAAEEVIDIELGLPPGTIDITRKPEKVT